MKFIQIAIALYFTLLSAIPITNATNEDKLYTIFFEPKQLSSTNAEALKTSNVVTVDTREEALMYPNSNVYIKSDNTLLSPLVENTVSASWRKRRGTTSKEYQRNEVRINNARFYKHPMIPISACHDSLDGFGGAVGYSGSLSAGVSISLGMDLGTMMITMIDISYGVGVSKTVSASESISCSVTEGDIVQIFVEPWIINVDYEHRTYYGTEKHKFARSAWKKANNDFPISVTPAPFCHTGMSKVKCGIAPVSQIFLKNGAYI